MTLGLWDRASGFSISRKLPFVRVFRKPHLRFFRVRHCVCKDVHRERNASFTADDFKIRSRVDVRRNLCETCQGKQMAR